MLSYYKTSKRMQLTPDSRVVRFNLHDHVRGRAVLFGVVQDVDVAAGGVAGVDDAAVPLAVAFLEDMHVVAVVVEAVKVEVLAYAVGMGISRHDLRVRASESVVVDDNPDAGVVVEVDDIVLRLETVKAAQVSLEQDRVVVVCAESAVVHEPELVCAVGLEGHV
jgi:hypothetical protein